MIEITDSPSIAQLRRELKALGDELEQGKAVRAGLVAAIKPVKPEAKSLARKDTGDMAQAIGHRSLSKRAKQRLGIASSDEALLVGPNRKVNGRYQGAKGRWNEFGTTRNGKKIMKARPFMAPALQAHEGGLEARFYAGLSKFLARRGKK